VCGGWRERERERDRQKERERERRLQAGRQTQEERNRFVAKPVIASIVERYR